MKPKISKIKSDAPLKIVRIVLWFMIIFIFLRGVIAILNSNDTAKQRQELETYMQQKTMQETAKNTAIGFAENFIRDYLTDTGERDSDYAYRMSKYVAEGLNIESPGIECKVKTVNTLETSFADEMDAVVTVLATVAYEKTEKTFTIKVPLHIADGRCAVYELPQIVPAADKAEVDVYAKEYTGTEVSDAAKKEIKPVLESFFATYYSGNENELSYYITEKFPYKHGLNGDIEFDEIDAFRVYFDSASGEYSAMAALTISDGNLRLKQNIYLTLSNADGRYYIDNISTF